MVEWAELSLAPGSGQPEGEGPACSQKSAKTILERGKLRFLEEPKLASCQV
jgi:hypothetical protein